MYSEIHLSKREILNKFISNIPLARERPTKRGLARERPRTRRLARERPRTRGLLRERPGFHLCTMPLFMIWTFRLYY